MTVTITPAEMAEFARARETGGTVTTELAAKLIGAGMSPDDVPMDRTDSLIVAGQAAYQSGDRAAWRKALEGARIAGDETRSELTRELFK